MKGQLCRLADESLETRRIAEAGRLDEDAVVALALDARLGRTELIDAAVDHLDRLGNDPAHPLLKPPRRIGEAGEAVIANRQIELIDRAAAEEARDQRVAERLQPLARVVELVEVADAQLNRLALDRKPGVADARLLQQHLANVADQGLQPFLDIVRPIDLVEEIGAALQVEAEDHLLVGQETRPALELLA